MSHEKPTIVALLTDFGRSDGYDAMMKAAMLAIHRHILFVDITHEITPAGIRQAAFVLGRSYRFFPDGVLFVVVVDPGVGSERNILLLSTERFRFLAPDNGVLQYVFKENPPAMVRQVTMNQSMHPKISSTFHGRDIFAPVAAHLAAGVADDEIGPVIKEYNRGFTTEPTFFPNGLDGEVIYIDRFGNAITNIAESMLPKLPIRISLTSHDEIKLYSFYQEVDVGTPLALVNSDGLLEIAVREGHAARWLGVREGDLVRVKW